MQSRTLNLLAAAAVVAAQTPTCNIRLVNEVTGTPFVSLFGANTTVVQNLSTFGVSPYFAKNCPQTLTLADSSGAQLQTISIQPSSATSRQTIVVISTPWDTILVKTLLDQDAQLGDSANPSSVDFATYRVFNAYAAALSMDVHGVSHECWNCTHPYVTTLLFGDSTSPDADSYPWIDTTFPYEFQFKSADGAIVSDIMTVTHLEHGVYTIFIHNLPSPSNQTAQLVTWTVDVDGRNAYLPILYAVLVLISLGIAHKIAKHTVVKMATTTDLGDKVAARLSSTSKSGDDRHVTLLAFFGFDKAVAKAVSKPAGGRTGTASSEIGTINGDASSAFSERLLSAVEDGSSSATASTAPGAAAKLAATTKPRSSGRIRSIDAFRGFCLCIMIFVNYGGGGYSGMFDHSRWNGLTVADLVFPWFVWTSGVSMAISFASERRKGASRRDLAWKVIIRSAKLYAIGLFLNNGANISQWRILGVLQYFAVGNLVVGVLEAFLSPHHSTGTASNGKAAAVVDAEEGLPSSWKESLWMDVGRYWAQWAVMLTLGLVYMLFQSLLTVDGCPTGYIGPGGLADQGAYLGKNCTGGAHRLIDVSIFSINHIYHNTAPNGAAVSAATCNGIYQCDVHDPEGALGWISAAWMAWLGLQAGRVIVNYRFVGHGPGGVKATVGPYVGRWILWGVALSLIGGALCGFSKNEGWLPINKNLWSPSFVFVLAGWGYLKLAFHYLLVDVHKVWTGAPFRYVGTNSIGE